MSLIPERLKFLFNQMGELLPEVEKSIAEVLQHSILKKKRFLLDAGRICNNIYFIDEGLVRSFYYEEELEVTSWFMKENDIIISVESFFMQKRSKEYIQALENTSLYYISYDDLMQLYKAYPTFNTIGRRLTEIYYIKSEERLNNIRLRDSFKRYAFLVSHHPAIIQRSPGKYIASYLSITEETLSRMRAKKLI